MIGFALSWFLGKGDGFKAILAAIAGGVVAFLLFMAWNTAWDNPGVRRDAQAELTANFHKAIGELGNEADKARARRRLCAASGGVYDFATGDCKQD